MVGGQAFCKNSYTNWCLELGGFQYHKAKEGSTRKAEAGLDLMRTVSHRMHIDKSVELVGKLIFGVEAGPTMLTAVREGQALVDDWACLKNMVTNVENLQWILYD